MKYFFSLLLLSFISTKNYAQTSIEIKDISKHIGDSIVTIGKVFDAFYSQAEGGSIIFKVGLSVDQAFDVLIKNENRSNFKFTSEKYFINKDVRISGKVTSVNGKPGVLISREGQLITILSETPTDK